MCNKFVELATRVYSQCSDCCDREVIMTIGYLQFLAGVEVTPEALIELLPEIEGDTNGWPSA